MWHEARKQERKIRGMLVDYRKRAERRRDFYEKIRADPTQFLQLHGRQCKIHLDPNVAAAADSPAAMMPWQGQTDNLIDRFDVRAHLDYIPPVNNKFEEDEITNEERQLNYERYRIIAQNSFLGITEEKFLKQLHLEEQFGYTENEKNKTKKTGGAAIGFNYDDGTAPTPAIPPSNSSDEQSDSDLDVDLAINVSKMDPMQAHEMNRHGRNFGMSTNDFYSFLTNDMEEAENYRLAKEEEHEKALFSGRKSRRERRAHREKRLANRVLSPPSYAARISPTYPILRLSKSVSKSPSPENTGKITYITSFGDEDEPSSSSKPTYADKVKYGKPKKSDSNKEHRIVYFDVSAGNNHERHKKRPRFESSDDSSPRRSKERRRSAHRSYSKRYRRRSSTSSSSFSSSSSSTSSSRSHSRKRSLSRNRRSLSRSRRSLSKNRRSLSKNRRSSSKTRSLSKNRRSRSICRSRRRSYSRSISKESSSRSRRRSKSRNRSRKSRSSSRSSRSFNSSSTTSPKKVPIKKETTTSRSRSPSVKKESPPKVMTRYYGRKRSDQSSSESSEVDEGAKDNAVEDPQVSTLKSSGNSGTSTKKTPTNLSLQERLRRKRQALLNKQFKADKIAEQLKTEREKQEQQNREDELREMAIKLRRRQRERRHAYDSNSTSSSDNDRKSKSPLPTVEYKRSKSNSPSRDRKSRDSRDFKDSKKYDTKRDRDRDHRSEKSSRYEDSKSYKSDNDRDKAYRKRDDYDSRRESYKNRDHGRSLVDY
ncbi:CLK4-associating serine/arginine rich protein [Onthophagus taurus]|uniref:CLK4-associating serine/arginine rich protein n=1 Tax=Onthophagus taurus TaxID=166361 RepID=UPI000C2045A1|nr:CLK4-associating serine/arginine rich protein [Onthophagus taurus]